MIRLAVRSELNMQTSMFISLFNRRLKQRVCVDQIGMGGKDTTVTLRIMGCRSSPATKFLVRGDSNPVTSSQIHARLHCTALHAVYTGLTSSSFFCSRPNSQGLITEVGLGVTRFQVGDRVAIPFILSCGDCGCCNRGQVGVVEYLSCRSDVRLLPQYCCPVLLLLLLLLLFRPRLPLLLLCLRLLWRTPSKLP